MPSYTYEILTKEGKKKKGTVEGAEPNEAKAKLRAEGATILSFKAAGAMDKQFNLSIGKSKPSSRDLAVFCRQFTSILGAGVGAVDALDMLSQQTAKKTLADAIANVKVNVQKGDPLATAMKKEGETFPSLLISMVDAGEKSGSLEVALSRMADQFEKDAKMKGMVKKAMIYPCVLIFVMLGVLAAMMLFIIPNFMNMFADMDIEMPAFTMAVIHMSDFMLANWYFVIAVIVAIVLGIKAFKKTEVGKHFFGKIAIKAPIFGNLTVKTACSSFARTTSTLLAAGMPLIATMDIVSNTMENIFFKEALRDAREQIKKGYLLSLPLKNCGLFPPMVYHMVSIGEETGNMEEMLDNIAKYYDEEVQTATESLAALMEPLVILLMAVVVGVLIMAIFQPMIKMYQSF